MILEIRNSFWNPEARFYISISIESLIRNYIREIFVEKGLDKLKPKYYFSIQATTDIGCIEFEVVGPREDEDSIYHIIYIPYLPVKNAEDEVEAYLDYLFRGFTQILAEYQVSKASLDETLAKIKKEVLNNPRYAYKELQKTRTYEEIQEIIGQIQDKFKRARRNKLENISIVSDWLYEELASEPKGSRLAYTKARSSIHWEELNEKILKDLGKLVQLSLEGGFNQELSFLNGLSNLKILDIALAAPPDFEQIPLLENILDLDIGDKTWPPFSVAFVQKFPRIKLLGLVGKFRDLEYLETLKHLELLNLSKHDITDYSFLKNLPQLKHLSILYNQNVTDLSVIGRLKEVFFLELRELSQLENIDFVSEIPTLTYLNITLPALKKLPTIPNLKRLDIQEIGEALALTSLTNISSLEELNLDRLPGEVNELIKVLEQLPNLKIVHINTKPENNELLQQYLVERNVSGLISESNYGHLYQHLPL